MCLPPKPQQPFLFIHARFNEAKMSFPHWRCRQTQFCCSPPRCRSHFFYAPALVAVHNCCFLIPSNDILLVLRGMTLCVPFGELDFRTSQIRHVYFARGVQKMNADSRVFKNQWNSLHSCMLFEHGVISLEGFNKWELAFPPSAPYTFFCRRRPAWEC